MNSRYYNLEWGRYLNADSYIGTPGELLSCNMFDYCSNNPVNRYDNNEHFWEFVADAIEAVTLIPVEIAAVITVGVVAVLASVAVQSYRNHHVKYNDSTPSQGGQTSNNP